MKLVLDFHAMTPAIINHTADNLLPVSATQAMKHLQQCLPFFSFISGAIDTGD